MVHFLSLVCVLVLTFTSCIVTAQKQQRMRWLETRLKSLESRLNIDTVQKEEEYTHIIESVSSLNLTINNLYDMLNENGSKKKTDGIVTFENCQLEEFQRKITTALRDEKKSVRNTIESLSIQLELFKTKQQQSCEDEISVIENEVTDIRREFKDYQQRTRREIKDSKIDIDKNKQKITNSKMNGQMAIRVLRNEINDKLSKQESQIKGCLDALDKMKQEKSQTCPDEWTMYNNFCYRFYSVPKVYSNAQNHCVRMRADIVDIQDKEEDYFVSTLLGQRVIWIGLQKHGGSWDRTKSVATYTNWYPGQPDDLRGGEECVDYLPNDGTWFDTLCNNRKSYICKRSI